MNARMLLGATMLALAPAAALAQVTLGSIEATLDGEARTWQTLGSTRAGESYNTVYTDYGFGMYQVSIQGFAGSRPAMAGTLQIVFGGSEGAQAPSEVEIIYVPERMSQSWALPDEASAQAAALNIERLEVDGDAALVSGAISAELCYKEGLMAPPDPDNCITIEGRFETELPVEAF